MIDRYIIHIQSEFLVFAHPTDIGNLPYLPNQIAHLIISLNSLILERDVLAAMIFVQKMPHVSEQCKRYSHQIACTHMFKVCDQQFTSMETRPIITLCKSDCEKLKVTYILAVNVMLVRRNLGRNMPK